MNKNLCRVGIMHNKQKIWERIGYGNDTMCNANYFLFFVSVCFFWAVQTTAVFERRNFCCFWVFKIFVVAVARVNRFVNFMSYFIMF